MKNKLLLGTALATSLVAVNTASFADAKVTGSVEMTYNSVEDTTSDSDGDIGSESTVKFSGTKDLDIGTMTTSFKLEEAAIEAPNLQIKNGDTTIGVGADFAPNLSFNGVPTVGDHAGTVTKNVATSSLLETTEGSGTIKNANGLLVAQSFDGGKLSAYIVPSMGSTQSGGSDSGLSSAASSGSAYNLMFSGNMGVDGLSVKAGINDKTGKDGNADGSATNVALSYNFGQFSAGVQQINLENVDTSANQDEYETTSVGVAFAANDNLSFSLNMYETDGDTDGTDLTSKEEATMVAVGYSLGGLGLEISFAEIEDIAGTAGDDGDSFQIRTVGKF